MSLWPFKRRSASPREVVVGVGSLLAFLRAGGSVSLETWVSLPEDVQVALEDAGRAWTSERILALAAALRSEDGALEVARGLDGGLVAADASTRRALDRAASLMQPGRMP